MYLFLPKTIGKKLQAELTFLADEIATYMAIVDEANVEILKRKNRILEINQQYDFPEHTEKSQAFSTPSGRIRVTRSEASPEVDPMLFLEAVGPEIFLDVCTPLKVDFDVIAWTEHLKREEVKEETLLNCLLEKNQPKPRVALEIKK